MAEHYGTAIIPARPRAPKDKAAVEGTVGVVSTFILAALRNQQFLSIRELNEAVWDRLYGFNHKPFQKKNGSRASAFEEEKLFLLPLPGHPFELATWRIATVQYNYHISVDTQNYSCPYEYIKQKVDVRMTRSTVEIFFDGNRIASLWYGQPHISHGHIFGPVCHPIALGHPRRQACAVPSNNFRQSVHVHRDGQSGYRSQRD
jgi:hypothetical protein